MIMKRLYLKMFLKINYKNWSDNVDGSSYFVPQVFRQDNDVEQREP